MQRYMISKKTLIDCGSCQDGIIAFKARFGDKTVTLQEAFNKMPKTDVIWFALHAIHKGFGPEEILSIMPVRYRPTHKGPAIKWLNKNYQKFISQCNKLWDNAS